MKRCPSLLDKFFSWIAVYDFLKNYIEFLDSCWDEMLSFLPAVRGKAPLAQLDRASDYESEGREFESLRVYFLTFYKSLIISVLG